MTKTTGTFRADTKEKIKDKNATLVLIYTFAKQSQNVTGGSEWRNHVLITGIRM